MSAGTFGPTLTHGTGLAQTSIAQTKSLGGSTVVTLRSGANGVGDNQRLQAIAQALGRGDVTAAQVNA